MSEGGGPPHPGPCAGPVRTPSQRTAQGVVESDGTGTFLVTGEAGGVAAAMERVDDLARRLRADGDRRTLTPLRGDVAHDLVLYGWVSPARVQASAAATFVGQPPPARVHPGGLDGHPRAGRSGGGW